MKKLFVIVSLFCATNALAGNSLKPNILFIMSDDHTSQVWGIYGGILKNYVHAPNISRLA
ncbi:MAG: acetylglucosamine-6-sulfatase, partial [Planctomycetota bacterium]